jgi:NAD-dependent SIR2 family protein deacetylase
MVSDMATFSRAESDRIRQQPGYYHPVGCIYCRRTFDLLRARWCEHTAGHASKLCPGCGRCLCGHPMYTWPHLWREASPLLRSHGFDKLFVLYTRLFTY